MSKNNTEWKISQAKFQGFVKAKLEGIESSLKINSEQTNKNTESIATIKGWAAVLGGLAGALSGFIGRFWK